MRSERKAEIYKNRDHANRKNHKKCQRSKNHKTGFIGRFMTGMAALVLVMALSFGFGSFFSSAHDGKIENSAKDRYYKIIQIKKGDSLWSIAQRYRDTEEDSVYEYMSELAEANHLNLKDMNNLREGDYLVVAYYGDEPVY